MKLRQLNEVLAIVERGSLRAAARQLGTAQSAVTRSIRELEQELGAELFERSVTGMVLTPVGAALVKRAAAIDSEVHRIRDEVAQLKGQRVGSVSVGLSTAPHVSLLPRVLGPFERLYPDVRLNIEEGLFPSMEAQLRSGAIDFYVGPVSEDHISGEFRVERLMENLRVILGRPGHPLKAAKSLHDLVDARWVATSVTVDSRAELDPVFETEGLPPPKIALQAHSALTMIVAAASSDLLALLPQQWLEFANSTGLLAHIQVKEQIAAPDLCLVTRSSLPLTPIAERLSDQFRKAASNLSRQSQTFYAAGPRRS